MTPRMQPIDPTKNVLDLVKAESKYQDAMREAETRRINDLASLRVYYDGIIEGMRANNLKLLAEQLKENKADSSGRTSLLEQFRWESGAKSQGISLVGIVAAQAAVLLIASASLVVAILK